MIMGVIMVGGIIANKSPVNLDMTTPLARLTFEWNALAVPVDSPIKTVKDFAEALKKDPGALPVGGGSAGGVDHVTLALIAKASGVPVDKLNYVGFSGGAEMLTALGGGKLKAAISGVSEMAQQAKAGKVRIIAVTSEKGSDGAPSLKEGGVNVVLGNWRGMMGAPGMSDAGKKAWLARLDKMCASKEWAEGLAKQGLENACLTGDKFAAFLKEEQTRWAATLKDVGIAK
jgi:putative tricarboxylic transport membrane protein